MFLIILFDGRSYPKCHWKVHRRDVSGRLTVENALSCRCILQVPLIVVFIYRHIEALTSKGQTVYAINPVNEQDLASLYNNNNNSQKTQIKWKMITCTSEYIFVAFKKNGTCITPRLLIITYYTYRISIIIAMIHFFLSFHCLQKNDC